jgi:hypothetical protein
MALKITHDGSSDREQKENCCICRAATPYWHRSDVALCEECAKVTKLAALPTKAEWCAKERDLTPNPYLI